MPFWEVIVCNNDNLLKYKNVMTYKIAPGLEDDKWKDNQETSNEEWNECIVEGKDHYYQQRQLPWFCCCIANPERNTNIITENSIFIAFQCVITLSIYNPVKTIMMNKIKDTSTFLSSENAQGKCTLSI